ncbi:hypothetical protein GCM10023149_26030 [Mucilaginibacter gynuensis]|uniref:PKD domain-containing protein n=1 Tax=Mucilaginibacter gynuensis TaxID=1302236 RepID=A0ABP8GHC1_9SPHI
MKKLTYNLIVAIIALLITQSCKKLDQSTVGYELVASKTILKIQEPDSLLVLGASANDSINWTVAPSGFSNIIKRGNAALAIFRKAGNYTVTATVNGSSPVSTTITVTDSVYQPAEPQPTHIPLTGDQIVLHANFYEHAETDSAYLYFTAITTKHYTCGNSIINYTKSLDAANHFGLTFIDVTKPADPACLPGGGAISSDIIDFRQHTGTPYLTDGTYPLTVTLNGTTYTGSITVTATSINFSWPYTAGVTITPLHINR